MARRPLLEEIQRKPSQPKRAKRGAKPAAASAPRGKWVYAFGGGKAEGKPGMRESARRQGRGPRRDGEPRPAGAARLHHHHRGLHALLRQQEQPIRRSCARRSTPAWRISARITGKFGDRDQSAAGLGALRRARLDAGHDGHGAQPRPQRRDGRGAGEAVRRQALRLRQLPPLHHHVFQRGARHRASQLRGHPRRPQGRARATRSTPSSRPTTGSTLVARYKERVAEEQGKPFPQDPHEQLWGAIGAVFGSWMNQRAITYRRLHNIPESWGTAVNVQAMVFGNMGDTSATGVAFTRNPSTGEKRLYGEFLINAQGEDVVAGIRTPQEITEVARKEAGSDKPSMESAMPAAFKELTPHLRQAREALPRHAGPRVHRRAGQALDAADAAPASAPPRRRCASPSSSRTKS